MEGFFPHEDEQHTLIDRREQISLIDNEIHALDDRLLDLANARDQINGLARTLQKSMEELDQCGERVVDQ